jgi:hypothetical protein
MYTSFLGHHVILDTLHLHFPFFNSRKTVVPIKIILRGLRNWRALLDNGTSQVRSNCHNALSEFILAHSRVLFTIIKVKNRSKLSAISRIQSYDRLVKRLVKLSERVELIIKKTGRKRKFEQQNQVKREKLSIKTNNISAIKDGNLVEPKEFHHVTSCCNLSISIFLRRKPYTVLNNYFSVSAL